MVGPKDKYSHTKAIVKKLKYHNHYLPFIINVKFSIRKLIATYTNTKPNSREESNNISKENEHDKKRQNHLGNLQNISEIGTEIGKDTQVDLTLRNDIIQPSSPMNGDWIPSADLSRFYSYDMIKNWNVPKPGGGIWDIGEKENMGMWKTTLALFGCLATLAICIIIISG